MSEVIQPSGRIALWPRLAMAVIVLSAAYRPGDALYIDDEPRLVAQAIRFNHLDNNVYGIHLPFMPAPVGLEGNRGAYYGPLPIWVYQFFLAVTGNLMLMVALRALLVGAATAWALDALADLLGVSRWLAVVTMLSPWLWYYSRQLWDNTFCIPLGAVMLAAYGKFLVNRRGKWLCATLLAGMGLLLTHFMSAALVVPVALHALVYQWRGLLRFKWILLGAMAAVIGISWPYWDFLAVEYRGDIPGSHADLIAWLMPLLGAHHLTAAGLGALMGDDWLQTLPSFPCMAAYGAQSISLIAYPLCWIGVFLSGASAWQIVRKRSNSPRDHLALISLATFLAMLALDVHEHLTDSPHYFNGTWIAFVVFVWIAAGRWPKAWPVLAVYATALMTMLATMTFVIARDGGTRLPGRSMGLAPSLSSQIAAVQRVQQFSRQSTLSVQAYAWKVYPWELTTLQALNPPPAQLLPPRRLVVRYRYAFAGDARLTVDDQPLLP